MKQHGFENTSAELVEAADLKADIRYHRLALGWGQMEFTQAVQRWDNIESHDTLAYEDKVAAQVYMLDEPRRALCRLQTMIARARRVLQRHRWHLRY